MTVNPTIRVGLAPRGRFIDTTQSLGNVTKILLFLVPDGPFGLCHQFGGTDRELLTQAQEIAEK